MAFSLSSSSSSSSSSSKTLHFSRKVTCLILAISLLLGCGIEARPGRMIMEEETSRVLPSQHKKEYRKEYAYKPESLLFTMLPKGVPIPPSAPSKRHNAFVDSSPQN